MTPSSVQAGQPTLEPSHSYWKYLLLPSGAFPQTQLQSMHNTVDGGRKIRLIQDLVLTHVWLKRRHRYLLIFRRQIAKRARPTKWVLSLITSKLLTYNEICDLLCALHPSVDFAHLLLSSSWPRLGGRHCHHSSFCRYWDMKHPPRVLLLAGGRDWIQPRQSSSKPGSEPRPSQVLKYSLMIRASLCFERQLWATHCASAWNC